MSHNLAQSPSVGYTANPNGYTPASHKISANAGSSGVGTDCRVYFDVSFQG